MNMGLFESWLAGLGVLFVSAMVTPFFAKRRQFVGWTNFLCTLVAGAIFGGLSAKVFLEGGGTTVLNLGFASVPLLFDGFSAIFLSLITLMAVVTAFYSIGYMEHYSQYGLRGYYLNFPLFMMGMVGIVTVDDLSIGFTIAWQLMTVASFFLIRFDHRDPAIVRSANKYLVLMELAWLLVVVGAALVSSGPGNSVHELTQGLAGASMVRQILVYSLLLVGFGLKAGVFPLGQLWLPDAHSSAPSPISALLSGVMIKTGVYGIVRTLFWMIPLTVQENWGRTLGLVLAIFAVVTLFIGTVQALKQHDAKRLHAYHSIGQMGYILLGIGVAHYFFLSASPVLKILSVLALIGALYHTINHAVFKGLLFLCTGSVQYATGMKDLNKLGGLIGRMPITAIFAAIAAASIAGVPAFSGFMSKWAVISSGLLGGREAAPIVFFGIIALMTSAITLASYVKFFGMTFTAVGIEWNKKKEVREVGSVMLLPKAVLSGICIVQGLLPWVFVTGIAKVFAHSEGSIVQWFFAQNSLNEAVVTSNAGVAIHLPGGIVAAAAAMPLVLAVAFAASFAVAAWFRRAGGGKERVAQVWMCGYQGLDDSTRYRSSSMYAAFKNFMKWTGGNVRD